MAKDWIRSWKRSTQPRRQRKFRNNAPRHVRRKFMSVNLTPSLRKKHGRRNFPVRIGDKVKVMRGSFSGKSGKVSRVDLREEVLFIDSIEFTKKDGTKITKPIHPSNVQITDLDLSDKRRAEALARAAPKKQSGKKEK